MTTPLTPSDQLRIVAMDVIRQIAELSDKLSKLTPMDIDVMLGIKKKAGKKPKTLDQILALGELIEKLSLASTEIPKTADVTETESDPVPTTGGSSSNAAVSVPPVVVTETAAPDKKEKEKAKPKAKEAKEPKEPTESEKKKQPTKPEPTPVPPTVAAAGGGAAVAGPPTLSPVNAPATKGKKGKQPTESVAATTPTTPPTPVVVASPPLVVEKKIEEDTSDTEQADEKAPLYIRRKTIPKHIKTLVWNKYIGRETVESKCLSCKQEKIDMRNFHCGHVIAEAKGGDLTINNLRPICAPCNLSMGTKSMNEFTQEFFGWSV